MKTTDSLIQYNSKADYLAKKPAVPKLSSDTIEAKELGKSPSKVEVSDKAKDIAEKVKELPKKVEAKAKETVSAGKHLLDGAAGAFKKVLKTPGLSDLMPDLGGPKKATKLEKNSMPKTLHQPAVIFINGFNLDVFDSGSGLDLMAENIPRAKVFSWDQEEEILDVIQRTDTGQPVILLGQGMGGDTAVEITNKLNALEFGFRSVNLLVTMDSIGFENDIIPQNVGENLNVISDEDLFFNDGPNIARNTKATKVINELRTEGGSELDDSSDVQFMVFDKLNSVLGDAVRKRNAEHSRVKSLIDKIHPSR